MDICKYYSHSIFQGNQDIHVKNVYKQNHLKIYIMNIGDVRKGAPRQKSARQKSADKRLPTKERRHKSANKIILFINLSRLD